MLARFNTLEYVRKLTFSAFIVIPLIVFIASAETQNASAALQFGVIDLPPYGCESPKDSETCFQNQFLVRLQEELGHPISVTVMPFARVLDSITSGAIDFTITIDNKNVEKHTDVKLKIADLKMTLYRWRENESTVGHRPWRLGVLRSAEYGNQLDGLIGAEVFSILDFQQGMSMFAKKRLDGIVGPSDILDLLLAHHQIDKQNVWQPIDEWEMPVCDPQKSMALRNGLNQITEPERQKMMDSALQANFAGNNF